MTYIGHIIGSSNAISGVWEPVLMLLLLAGSAFFSGTETAFFNLSRRQINLLKKSTHKLQNLTAALLDNPKQLLSCLLFGNMTVNIFFYAVSSVIIVRIQDHLGVTAAAIAAFIAFAVLVLFGEILPKTLAYANSKAVSVANVLPSLLLVKIFSPLQFVFRFFIVDPAIRLFLGPVKSIKPITTAEFKSLIEQLRKRGLITADENKLLIETIELGSLKVRDCLTPRVDMIACDVTESAEKARQIMWKNNLTKIPVYIETIDNIVGQVFLRQLLLAPDKSLDKLIQKVHFVPEQKSVESLIEFFRTAGTDMVIVVDEYGGIAGSIRLADIVEELLGPIEVTGEVEPIEQIGPFEYRLAGNLAIHDWAPRFGVDIEQTRISTIGGLVTAALGKIPRPGDVAYLRNLKFTVERMQKRRIETLILTLEPVHTDG